MSSASQIEADRTRFSAPCTATSSRRACRVHQSKGDRADVDETIAEDDDDQPVRGEACGPRHEPDVLAGVPDPRSVRIGDLVEPEIGDLVEPESVPVIERRHLGQ